VGIARYWFNLVSSLYCKLLAVTNLRERKSPTESIIYMGKIAALVLLKLFINRNEKLAFPPSPFLAYK